MKKPALVIAVAGLLGLAGFLAWKLWPHARPSEADLAIARIEELGGWVETDEQDAEKPVVAVSLSATRAGDADLEILARFPQLQRLYLGGAEISSAGLLHLRNLTSLRELYLLSTRIDDSGLEHLRELRNLRTLDLSATQITGAGLKHLQGLPHLESLILVDTRVSPEAVQSLQRVLPALTIAFKTF